ncbi:MAG: YcxB family protein [Clostridiales bacterium]|nr:YcxB family protein [Clostridiales bacterium]
MPQQLQGVTVCTTYTYDLIRAFLRAHFQRERHITHVLAAVVACAYGYLAHRRGYVLSAGLPGDFAAALGLTLALLGIGYLRVSGRALRRETFAKTPLAGRSEALRFGPEALEVSATAGEISLRQHLPYAALYRILETGDALYLYEAPVDSLPNGVHIVKKGALSPAELECIRLLLWDKKSPVAEYRTQGRC